MPCSQAKKKKTAKIFGGTLVGAVGSAIGIAGCARLSHCQCLFNSISSGVSDAFSKLGSGTKALLKPSKTSDPSLEPLEKASTPYARQESQRVKDMLAADRTVVPDATKLVS